VARLYFLSSAELRLAEMMRKREQTTKGTKNFGLMIYLGV
jgi:hypothetical protein